MFEELSKDEIKKFRRTAKENFLEDKINISDKKIGYSFSVIGLDYSGLTALIF